MTEVERWEKVTAPAGRKVLEEKYGLALVPKNAPQLARRFIMLSDEDLIATWRFLPEDLAIRLHRISAFKRRLHIAISEK